MMFHWRHSRHLYGQFGKYSGHGKLRVTGMTVLGARFYMMPVPIRPYPQRIITQPPWGNSIYDACS